MRIASRAVLLAALAMIPTLRSLDAQIPTPPPTAPRTPPATPPNTPSATPRAPERRGGEVRIERLPEGMSVVFSGTTPANRAVIGVSYASSASSTSDTAGVRLVDVQADGPAARAGLRSGDVITQVNGVSLRVSSADAADPSLAGIAERRLQRAMAKAKPGDDVELHVRSGSAPPVVKVKTVSASELSGQSMRSLAEARSTRPAQQTIGVSIGTAGSARDSLGLFVTSVVANGPAESAGVIEGERIAAINGIDVRVPREDVEDPIAADARVRRFVREVQKGEPGSSVTLRVVSNGRSRDVVVKTGSAPATDSLRTLLRLRDGSPIAPFDFMWPSVRVTRSRSITSR